MNIAPMFFDALMPMATFVLVIVFAFAGLKLYQPAITGWLGELKVQAVLEGLNANAYTHFHDVLLPIDGETTQIDHLLIIGDTCFVIETKAHDGWIFGNASARNWTQSFNKHSKYPFQNPIRQNHKHLLAIKPFLEGLKLVGVVVFTRATFKSPRIDGVLYSKELKSFVLKYEVNKSYDNSAAVQGLQKAMITDQAEHQAHVRRLQAKHGGRWRILVAKGFLLAAMALLVFRFVISPAATPVAKAPPTEAADTHPQQLSNKPVSRATVTKAVAKPQPKPPAVNGFSKGKVIISMGKNFQMLNVGQQTRDGWKLEMADTTSAVFLHVSGQRVKMTVRGAEYE